MTTLTGSPKQIAWAEDIRAEAIIRHEVVIHDLTAILAGDMVADWYTDTPVENATIAFMIDLYTTRLTEIRNETSAKTLIDNRNRSYYMWSEYLAQPGLAAKLVMIDETAPYRRALEIVADPNGMESRQDMVDRLRNNPKMPGAAVVFDWAEGRQAEAEPTTGVDVMTDEDVDAEQERDFLGSIPELSGLGFSTMTDAYDYYRDLCGDQPSALSQDDLRRRLAADGYGFSSVGTRVSNLMIVPQEWWDSLFAE